MAIPTPTNCWTKATAAIAGSLSRSAAFQAMTGSADATEAAAVVFGAQLDQALNGEVYAADEKIEHYGQVSSAETLPYHIFRSGPLWEPGGEAAVFLERRVSEAAAEDADPPQELEVEWENTVGDVMNEVIDDLLETGGPFPTEFRVNFWGWNPRERWPQEGRWQGADLSLVWGRPQA